jgi:hypothetical protein
LLSELAYGADSITGRVLGSGAPMVNSIATDFGRRGAPREP